MLLSAEESGLPGKHAHRLAHIHTANAGTTAIAAADTTTAVSATASSRRLSLSTPLTVAILAATFGTNISRQRWRNVADSPAVTSQLESALSGGDTQASRARAKLRKLLEAVGQVVGEKENCDDSASTTAAAAATAANVVTDCPELLLWEGKELLRVAKQLRDMVYDVMMLLFLCF